MIRLSVMYPTSSGSTFDWDYDLAPHLALARKLLSPFGLLRIEIDRGLGAFPPGTSRIFTREAICFFLLWLRWSARWAKPPRT
jgi:hypothetical protein